MFVQLINGGLWMENNEKSLVKLIARLSPWLAPSPSGYFVARASISHLDLPLIIGISVGIIIEFLGISSVHTWLWLADWNSNKRKSDPDAPTSLAAFLSLNCYGRWGSRPPHRHSRTARDRFRSGSSSVNGPLSQERSI